MRLHPHEFIRRFLIHVLPKGFHRIRHYGLFANANRAENIATARAIMIAPPPALLTPSGLLGDRWFSSAIARIFGKSVAVGIRQSARLPDSNCVINEVLQEGAAQPWTMPPIAWPCDRGDDCRRGPLLWPRSRRCRTSCRSRPPASGTWVRPKNPPGVRNDG
jgi:hypothetical protein